MYTVRGFQRTIDLENYINTAAAGSPITQTNIVAIYFDAISNQHIIVHK